MPTRCISVRGSAKVQLNMQCRSCTQAQARLAVQPYVSPQREPNVSICSRDHEHHRHYQHLGNAPGPKRSSIHVGADCQGTIEPPELPLLNCSGPARQPERAPG